MRTGNAPCPLWEDACVCATDAHNCRTVGNLAPHVQLSDLHPDLKPLALFYLHVSTCNNRGNTVIGAIRVYV